MRGFSAETGLGSDAFSQRISELSEMDALGLKKIKKEGLTCRGTKAVASSTVLKVIWSDKG